jgi:hypothetical protein
MEQKNVIINSPYLILARDCDLSLDTKFNQSFSFLNKPTFFLAIFFVSFMSF